MSKLKELLIQHEGFELKAYKCPAGKTTIGVGRNLDDRGISSNEAMLLLDNDIQYFTSQVDAAIPCAKFLSENRRNVLICMAFQMGMGGFLGFRKMLEALERSDWEEAACEMLNSKWANQTPDRAQDLALMMREG